MKIEKTKHDHSLTHLLKVGIFAMLMLAPLFASISQWCYATFNKNAKESYYGETINEEKSNIINGTELQENTKVKFLYYEITETITNYGYNGQIIRTENFSFNNFENINRLDFYIYQGGSIQINLYNNNTRLGQTNPTSFNNTEFVFTNYQNYYQNINWLESYNGFQYITYNKYSYLSESFYYGVNQMTESPLFNWTQNTALYTGIKAMTDNLQVQTNVIAVLVTYWTILTIIYIIIDIVLALFTKMTHLLVKSD